MGMVARAHIICARSIERVRPAAHVGRSSPGLMQVVLSKWRTGGRASTPCTEGQQRIRPRTRGERHTLKRHAKRRWHGGGWLRAGAIRRPQVRSAGWHRAASWGRPCPSASPRVACAAGSWKDGACERLRHGPRARAVGDSAGSCAHPLATPTPNVYRPAVIGSSSSAARMARAARWRKCSTLLPLAWAALCPEACGGVERGALGAFVGVATALWTKSRSASTVRGPVCSATRSPWRSSSSV